MINLYNTLTKRIEEFIPNKENQVTLYTCGPTVYSYLHVGNWVAYIRWDILVRTLEASGYKVKRVMNITDVGHLVSDADEGEDKMQKGAKREGKSAWEIAKIYTDDFMAGMSELGLVKPSYITKATEYIPQQLDLIKVLKNKGYTYQITDGIYFDTSKFKSYADFANLNIEELKKGARVEYNPEKRNPTDFALWKFSPINEKRDMEWDTPIDILDVPMQIKGFPGWHLECSAMAMEKLGNTIDIHTGGIDHISVHHTNEIAQSEAASGKKFANYWLHNNFLLVDGTKVSKSIGNTYELKDLKAKGFSAQDFRMFVLQSHYRTESNFTWDNLQAAKNRLDKWRQIADLRWQAIECADNNDTNCVSEQSLIFKHSSLGVLKALQSDLDTPRALIVAEDGLNHAELNGVDINSLNDFNNLLDSISDLLGLDIKDSDITAKQKEHIAQREQARANKDWTKSDKLRDILLKDGISLSDSKYGTFWSKIR